MERSHVMVSVSVPRAAADIFLKSKRLIREALCTCLKVKLKSKLTGFKPQLLQGAALLATVIRVWRDTCFSWWSSDDCYGNTETATRQPGNSGSPRAWFQPGPAARYLQTCRSTCHSDLFPWLESWTTPATCTAEGRFQENSSQSRSCCEYQRVWHGILPGSKSKGYMRIFCLPSAFLLPSFPSEPCIHIYGVRGFPVARNTS